MGMFSYICSRTGEAISSEELLVTLYHLEGGKIVEVMSGPYNGYGAVNGSWQVVHKLRKDGKLVDVAPAVNPDYAAEEWYTDWQEMVNLHFDPCKGNGMHAVKGGYDPEYMPSTCSEDDPNQGWGSGDEYCDHCGEEDCDGDGECMYYDEDE